MNRSWLGLALALPLALALAPGCRESAETASAAKPKMSETPMITGIPEGADAAAVIAKLPEEIQKGLVSQDPVERSSAILGLRVLPEEPRLVVLEHLWSTETDADARADILDEVSELAGEKTVRFFERVASERVSIDLRDDALYYMTLDAYKPFVNVASVKAIISQPGLPYDLADSAVQVLRAVGSSESVAALHEIVGGHPDDEVRVSAIVATAIVEKEGSRTFLEERLAAEKSERVRDALQKTIQWVDERGWEQARKQTS